MLITKNPPQRKIAALVLAAGASKRMGEMNKLLLPWPHAPHVLAHTLGVLADLPLHAIYLLSGHDHKAISDACVDYPYNHRREDPPPLHIVHNPHHADGMLTTLQCGLRTLPDTTDSAMILPADLPLLTTALLQSILAHDAPHRIVAPSYQAQRGHPVLFDRAFWPALLALPSHARPRDVIDHHPHALQLLPVTDDAILFDIDTPQAYQAALLRNLGAA